MNDNFKSLLSEYRKNKRISQIELAEMLDCSRSIISLWEDGSELPSRQDVIRISTFLKLNPDDVDNLLASASYPKLSGDELRDLINSNMRMGGIALANREYLSNFLGDTGVALAGTSASLDAKIVSIENILSKVSGSVRGSESRQNINMAKEIEKKLEPVTKEVKSIKEEIVPQLEAAKSALIKLDEFIRKNTDFLVTAVEGKGTLRAISNQIDSIDKRLGKVESQINISRDRIVAIVSIIIAIISACIALSSLAILIYTTIGS